MAVEPEVKIDSITGKLDRLDNSISILDEAVTLLENRFGLILFPQPPVSEIEGEDSTVGSEVRARVDDHIAKVDKIQKNVNNIIDRIDL